MRHPLTPGLSVVDKGGSLTQAQREAIQQELAQLGTGIAAMKPLAGYEAVVANLEGQRTALQRRLHFAKPVRARVAALQQAVKTREKTIEDSICTRDHYIEEEQRCREDGETSR